MCSGWVVWIVEGSGQGESMAVPSLLEEGQEGGQVTESTEGWPEVGRGDTTGVKCSGH